MAGRKTFDLGTARGLFEIASHGRRGSGRQDRLGSAEVAAISRTARGVPEVMVKVSGGGTSVKGVEAHLKYIDRRGKLEVETDTGDTLSAKGAEKRLLEDWDLDVDELSAKARYRGRSDGRAVKLVHNIVLSMPAGAPPEKVLEAAKGFARDEFALTHRYAMVLHTDQAHPHVHLVVKAVSEQGKRLNIRKDTLRGWRERFAEQLRAQGVEANATSKLVRGRADPRVRDGLQRIRQRADEAVRDDDRARGTARSERRLATAAAEVTSRNDRARQEIKAAWRALSERLGALGEQKTRLEVERYVASFQSDPRQREAIDGTTSPVSGSPEGFPSRDA